MECFISFAYAHKGLAKQPHTKILETPLKCLKNAYKNLCNICVPCTKTNSKGYIAFKKYLILRIIIV